MFCWQNILLKEILPMSFLCLRFPGISLLTEIMPTLMGKMFKALSNCTSIYQNGHFFKHFELLLQLDYEIHVPALYPCFKYSLSTTKYLSNLNLAYLFFLFQIYLFLSCISESMPGTHKGQKTAFHSLKLELQTIVSHVDTGDPAWVASVFHF